MYLHACRLCMHFEIIKNWNHQKTSCQTVCLTDSFLASGSFVKLFHKIPWFSLIIQVFLIPWFFHAWNLFFAIFQVFPWFPELVGTLFWYSKEPSHCHMFWLRNKKNNFKKAPLSGGLIQMQVTIVQFLQYKFCLFVCLIWFFTSHQQSFSYKGTSLPGLNQY